MENRCFELSDGWYIAKDENDEGIALGMEKEISKDAVSGFVPSIIQQFYPEYHGLAYYWCKFTPSLTYNENDRIVLRFGGVDYKADVWLNGCFVGSEESPETPFEFDVTDKIRLGEENLLAVRVLNPCDKEIDGINLLKIPHRNKTVEKSAGSNLNHGGIWYGVSLLSRPAAYIKDVFLMPDSKTGEVKIEAVLNSTVKCDGELFVKIKEKGEGKEILLAESFLIGEIGGERTETLSLTLPSYKLWEVDSPVLYETEITLRTALGEHGVSKRIGFREFLVKDGFFYLNGRKIFLKSAHTGNAFPIGQMFPVRPDHVLKDFIYAKSCGFNMLRAISGMLRPEQLDFADEVGLLIYEECFASWCVGNSQSCDWNDDESYAAASAKFPNMPLGDEETLLERWRSATEKMILRDRNHPSVVVWGLLNETKNNGVFRAAVDFIGRVRELDPTRVVVLNSGRFDYDLSIGSASNPYVNGWENTWDYDGDTEIIGKAREEKKNPNLFIGDNHYYCTVPIDEKTRDIYRGYGSSSKAVFQSELGVGPIFNVIDEYKSFKQYGERLDLEDCAWVGEQYRKFEADFYKLGLERIFAFPERLLKESQKNSAVDRRLVFDIIRSNPRISGYSLTGLLDHGMCGEGLWSYFRQWKPQVFDSVNDGWQSLRFCLFAPADTYSDGEAEFEAVLANDGVLKSGRYKANFAIVGDEGVVTAFSREFELDENGLAVPVFKEKLALGAKAGKYKFVAELEDAAARGNEIDFIIHSKERNYIGDAQVFCMGIDEKTKAQISTFGVTVKEYNGEECGILLVGLVDKAGVRRAVEAAKNGADVFFLVKDSFFDTNEGAIEEARAVIGDLRREYHHDWLYHKECVLADKNVFDGMGTGLAELRHFEKVFPGHIFVTDTTPDYPVCPAFQTGYFRVKGAYMLMYGMLGQSYGKGKVFFSGMDILQNLGIPVADRLLSNIIRYLKK